MGEINTPTALQGKGNLAEVPELSPPTSRPNFLLWFLKGTACSLWTSEGRGQGGTCSGFHCTPHSEQRGRGAVQPLFALLIIFTSLSPSNPSTDTHPNRHPFLGSVLRYFLKQFYLFCVHGCFACMYVCVPCGCVVEMKEGLQIPWNWSDRCREQLHAY